MSDELPAPVLLSDAELEAVLGTLDDRPSTGPRIESAEAKLQAEALRRGLDVL